MVKKRAGRFAAPIGLTQERLGEAYARKIHIDSTLLQARSASDILHSIVRFTSYKGSRTFAISGDAPCKRAGVLQDERTTGIGKKPSHILSIVRAYLRRVHVVWGELEDHFSPFSRKNHASLSDAAPSGVWITLAFPAKVVPNICRIYDVKPRFTDRARIEPGVHMVVDSIWRGEYKIQESSTMRRHGAFACCNTFVLERQRCKEKGTKSLSL